MPAPRSSLCASLSRSIRLAPLYLLLGCPSPSSAPPPTTAEPTPAEPTPPRGEPAPPPDEADPAPDAPPARPIEEANVGAVPPEAWPSDPRVAKAKTVLSTAQGVPESSLVVVSVHNVQWNNGAMGCPQPDMSYTQAIVEGYRIVIEYDGTRYSLHGRTGGEPFVCTSPS